MAVATNTNVVQFNGGNALSSSWPTDPTGGGVTHFALWTEQVGGSVLAGSPFTYAVSLPSGSPVQFLPESLQVFIPHNIRPGMWHNHLEGSLHGEFTLIAAYRTFEAILARGYTLSASPTRGEVYLGLHRGDAQTSSLGAILPTDSTSLTLVTGVSAQNGDFLRVTANAGDTHEIVRVSDRISATQFAIVRGQPDLDGRDTTQVYHNAGNTVEYLSGPALFNELVNTGRSFPTSPTVGQRFVFNLPASIPTAVDQNGLPVVITVPRRLLHIRRWRPLDSPEPVPRVVARLWGSRIQPCGDSPRAPSRRRLGGGLCGSPIVRGKRVRLEI